MFAFRNQEKVCWHQCLYSHCLKKKVGKKKKLQLPTVITQSHLVPGKQNPGSPFPRTDFPEMCSKKMKCVGCSIEKLWEFVWAACIKRTAPSASLLLLFRTCLAALNIFMRTHANSTCTNPNYNPPSPPRTHSHSHADIHIRLPWELQVSIKSKTFTMQ